MTGHVRKKVTSVKDKKNVRWYPVIELERGTDGKRRQKYLQGFDTKKEANECLTQTLSEWNKNGYATIEDQTFGEYMIGWLQYKSTQVRPGTLRQYAWLVNYHAIPSLGSMKLTKIRPAHLEDFYAELQAQEGISSRSILHLHRVIHQALDRAVAREQVFRNVAAVVKPPRPEDVEMQVWNEDQLGQFLSHSIHSRYAIAYRVLSATGMRPGELLGLRWQDVDLERGKIMVTRSLSYTGKGYAIESPKTAAGKRSIDLPPSVTEALEQHKKKRATERILAGETWSVNEDLVICTSVGTPVLQHNLRSLFLRLSRLAGLPRIRLYDLRHTHATILLAHGVHPKIVQERLGHSDITVTLNTYSHVIPGLQAAAALTIDSIFADKAVRK